MVTSRPSALKYPLSIATVKGAAGPSNFQSSENLTGVCAKAGLLSKTTSAAVTANARWFTAKQRCQPPSDLIESQFIVILRVCSADHDRPVNLCINSSTPGRRTSNASPKE